MIKQLKVQVTKSAMKTQKVIRTGNNAGYDAMGAVEELAIDGYKSQFDTNLLWTFSRLTTASNTNNQESRKW